jgi:hypothetical protein
MSIILAGLQSRKCRNECIIRIETKWALVYVLDARKEAKLETDFEIGRLYNYISTQARYTNFNASLTALKGENFSQVSF